MFLKSSSTFSIDLSEEVDGQKDVKVRGAEGQKRLGKAKFENGGKGEVCCSGNSCFPNTMKEK